MDYIFITKIIVTALCAYTFYTDFTRFKIYNWVMLALIILYPIYALLAVPTPEWYYGLALLVGLFFLGYPLFAFGLLGGGDVKIIAVFGLWIGSHDGFFSLAKFFLYFALIGGAFTILLLILRGILHDPKKGESKLPLIFQRRQPVAYGIPIIASFLILVWHLKVLG